MKILYLMLKFLAVERSSEQLPRPARNLLAKLEEENRRILIDEKHITISMAHSRKGSDASQVSQASG